MRVVRKPSRKKQAKKYSRLGLVGFLVAATFITFLLVNTTGFLDFITRGAVGNNTNIIFVDQNDNLITETKTAYVNVRLSSPWPATAMNEASFQEVAGVQDVKGTSTVILQVKSSSDDVTEDGSAYDQTAKQTWLGTGRDSKASWTGYRFSDATIPQGAVINSAKLFVYNTNQQWTRMRFDIRGDNTGNSSAFSSNSRPSQRSLTTSYQRHNSNSRWNANQWQEVSDVKTVVQEVINRSDWRSGNDLSLIMKGLGGSWGRKFVNSYDLDPGTSPRLVVSYTTSGTAQPTATSVPQATNTPQPTSAPTAIPTALPTATPIPYTTAVELAEDSAFSKNVTKLVYTSHPMIATYTFSEANPGRKTLYARFTSSNGQTQTFSNWIDLVSEPTATPIPTTPPTGGDSGAGQNSHAMGRWNPNLKYDTCTVAEHDSYKVQGPDGKWYPTWHPPVHTRSDGSTCTFGHEHGRDPQDSKLYSFLKEQYGFDADKNGRVEGSELNTAGVPFGYVNEQLDLFNAENNITNGMRHEDHVGHKIEWENNVQRDWSTNIGGGSAGQRTPSGIYCDFFMKIHQGTHSKDAFTNNMHEIVQAYECTDGIKMANAQMLLFGKPGGFTAGRNAGSTPYFQYVGEATPSNSPSSGDNVIGRAIGDIDAVVDHILVPEGSWSLFSDALYEDWISGNYVRTPNGTMIAYYDPHFAVFGPSRFFWSGSDTNTYGITRTAQDKADNVGRSVDTCFMTESNGERARGGSCDWMTNYGQIKSMAWDDPRSAFNGVKREFYFNNLAVQNTGGNTVWYADPFGNNAQTSPFVGSVRHYLRPKNDPTPYDQPFESNAIGSDRNYGGNGVHAPN